MAQAQERVKFYHYTTKDGLSSNSVRCLYQDKKGFIWIGTDDGGLNRFDGISFTKFINQEENPQSVSNNQIFAITEDHQGFLWIATGEGLNRFDTKTAVFKRFYHDNENPKSLSTNKITALFVDSENTLWVGTSMGLHKYNREKEEFVNYYSKMKIQNQRPDKEISAIVDDNRGNLWLGTWWGGLKKFNKREEKFADFYSDPSDVNSIRNNNVATLFLDDQNILWVGNYLGGIRKFNIQTEKFLPLEDREKNAEVMGICRDKKGRIWYSRKGLGIFYPDSPAFHFFDYGKNNPSEISSGRCFPVLCDNTGIIWIGSDQGLSLYDVNRNRFSSSFRANNNGQSKIEKLYFDTGRNILWLGTLENGLFKYDLNTQKVKHFKTDKTPNDRFFQIQTLSVSKNDQLCIGTTNGIGIFDLETERIVKTLYNNPVTPTLVNHVYGNDEFMWLANDNTDNVRIFDVLHEKEYTFSTSEQVKLPSQRIIKIINDNDSNFWIGTHLGLAKYNYISNQIKNFYNAPSDSTSVSNNFILSVFQDSEKNIWAGTQNGLNCYNAQKGNFERFNRNYSFASQYILDIKEDQQHNLWLFTNKGITKFNPESGLVRNYDEDDGLYFGKNVVTGNDGLFYCTGRTEGYYAFHPDSIEDNQVIPPVYITKFLLFNKEVPVSGNDLKTPLVADISETQEITLKHNQSYIGFEFVTLNYTHPEKNQFAYRMEGFDKDWYYTDAAHLSATYTNLNPGSYVFKVKASNNDGVWNEQGREIKVVILPPFWKTKLAYLIYYVIIFGLIYMFRNYILYKNNLKTRIEIERIKAEKLHEIDQMKLDFFGNISHEFRTPLTLISGPLDYLLELRSELDWNRGHKYLNLMKKNVDRLLLLISKVLDIRKLDSGFLNIYLKNDDIIQFIESLTDSFKFKAEQKNIHFYTIFHQSSCDTWFDPDVIDKIVSNLLSNAFKFTPDNGEISIEIDILIKDSEKWQNEKKIHNIRPSSHLVKITVKDNGIGIPSEQRARIFDRFYQADNQAGRSDGSGIGLALVKELIGLVDGKIELESEVNSGSCFTIWIPIGKDVEESQMSAFIPQSEILSVAGEELSLLNLNHSKMAFSKLDRSSEKPLILIVEDNRDMRLFVEDILQDNYEMLSASNGKIGFELAMEYIPDLIISDIMMPDMDGLEMCQLIRNNERTNHIPVILLTARSTEEYQVEGLFAGADDYIMKPFNARNLQLRVNNMIKSRQLLREKFSLMDFEPNSDHANSLDDAFINKIRGIVERHLDNPDFDPQKFAEEVGMSRTQFYRKIKAITNQTVNDFIFSIRINMATRLLITEDLNISETAYAVGFKTPDHFSKVFRNHIGMSPSKYIEKNRKLV
ncbi:MAG: response regulator [Prolixibacteraceae bacterium]|nr:response regulator [Prolixibacteraceae bacterium]